MPEPETRHAKPASNALQSRALGCWIIFGRTNPTGPLSPHAIWQNEPDWTNTFLRRDFARIPFSQPRRPKIGNEILTKSGLTLGKPIPNAPRQGARGMITDYFVQPEDRPPLCAPPFPYDGPRLDLSAVTLVIIETMLHDLAREAARHCLQYADYGEVLLFSDRSIDIPGAVLSICDEAITAGDQHRVTKFFLYGPWLDRVKTPFVQLLHWDSWIIDPAMWTSAFLDYDFIGAPWWYTDGRNVGCGAFAIRSVELMRFLAANQDSFPYYHPEDEGLCRHYRPNLEKAGFTWAPQNLAPQFCFECSRTDTGPGRHFGFHEVRNWPLVLPRDELLDRVKMAMRHQYLHRSGKLAQLLACAPWVARHLVDDALMSVRKAS